MTKKEAVRAIIRREGIYLIPTRAPDPDVLFDSLGYKLELPGGKVDPNDANEYEAIIRELDEELRCPIDRRNVRHYITVKSKNNSIVTVHYFNVNISRDIDLNPDDFVLANEYGTCWFSGYEINELDPSEFAFPETKEILDNHFQKYCCRV